MFNFVVRYLNFLRSVPLLPILFDSLLRLYNLIINPELMNCLDEIETEVLSWAGTCTCLHKYGGLQFNFLGKEIGHIHSNGILDIRFNRQTKHQLMRDGKIEDHHVFASSGWISFSIKKRNDCTYAKELLRMSYLRKNGLAPKRYPEC